MKTKFRILSFIIVSLTILSCNNNCEKENENLKDQIADYKTEVNRKNDLILKFDNKLSDFSLIQDSIRLNEQKIDSLQRIIRKKRRASGRNNKDLNSMLSEINHFLLMNEEIANELKDSIANNKSQKTIVNVLLNSIKDKQSEINKLKKEIILLQSEVSSLKLDKDNLTSKNELISSENQRIKGELQKFHISNFKVTIPLNRITNRPKKAKKIDYINFKVKIDKNIERTHGNVKFYIKAVAPKTDQILITKNKDYFIMNGSKIGYTVMFNFYFDGKSKSLEAKWEKPEEFKLIPGTYSVYFYMDDELIGQNSFYIEK